MKLPGWIHRNKRLIWWVILIYGIVLALLVHGTTGKAENPFLYTQF